MIADAILFQRSDQPNLERAASSFPQLAQGEPVSPAHLSKCQAEEHASLAPIKEHSMRCTDRLEALADTAIEAFGVLCFWCVPHVRDLAPIPRAKLAARQIDKYGGMRGLRLAAEIEAELRALGEKPWR